jgi:glycerol-3-phosphate dehydrogenase
VMYHDGQFDDARLAINLAQTCIEQGATALNYFKVVWLTKTDDMISGVVAKNMETGKIYTIKSKAVVNATGVFVDDLIQKDQPDIKALIQSSQGIHLVVDKEFMPGADAVMIPKTDDGRVLFVVPWHQKLLIGTTDTPLNDHKLDPVALEEEVSFVLKTVSKYFTKVPERKDVRSIFAGLRPLAAPQDGSQKTKEISRSHKIIVSPSGLVTIIGGKWTTYRLMAQDTVDKTIETAKLEFKPCTTENLTIHGNKSGTDFNDPLYIYGSDTEDLLALIAENPSWAKQMHPRLDYTQGEVIWAIRHEMPRTVEDILARRLRALFLDARAAIEMAPLVAQLMAKEMHRDEKWQQQQIADFSRIAKDYLLAGV